MAISATTIWEIETGGADTGNGGGFDPGQSANFPSTGTIGSGTGAAPTLSDASYVFVAADVNAWVYLPTQTNVNSGWYKIASVSGGVATLNATSGQWVAKSNMQPGTVQGCATTGSISGTVVWAIDYSQQSGNSYSLTATQTTTSLVITSSIPLGGYPGMVGNVVYLTGGGSTAGWYCLTAYAAGTFTIDRSAGAGPNVGATVGVGGAMASLGGASSTHVASNSIYAQAGTYTISSNTQGAAGGTILMATGTTSACTRLQGYGTYRGDYGTPPIFQATSSIGTWVGITTGQDCIVDNITINNTGGSSSKGFAAGTNATVSRCKGSGLSNGAFTGSSGVFIDCQATGCGTQPAFEGGFCVDCIAYANTVTGFSFANTAYCVRCIAVNNSGGSSDGFFLNGVNGTFINCTSYHNGRDGFRLTPGGNYMVLENCISEANSSNGFNSTAAGDNIRLYNCGTYNNTSAQIATNISSQNVFGWINNTTGSFFVSPGSGGSENYGLNNTTNQGALARAASLVGVVPGATTIATTSYLDLGAVQSQAAGTTIIAVQSENTQINVIGGRTAY